jgi:hypothetical protein
LPTVHTEGFGKEFLALTQRVFCPLTVADVSDDTQQHAFAINICPNGTYLDREGLTVFAAGHNFEADTLSLVRMPRDFPSPCRP